MAVMLFGMTPEGEDQGSNREVRRSRLSRGPLRWGMPGQEPFRDQPAVGFLAGFGAMLAEVVVVALETDDRLAGGLVKAIRGDATLFCGHSAVPGGPKVVGLPPFSDL